MFLLDTNVFSEATKLYPSPIVASWLGAQAEETLFVSVITLAEVRYGIELRAEGKRRQQLEAWYPDTVASFKDRVLSVDRVIAETWGAFRRRSDLARRTMPTMDGFLAATAEVHGLTIVTRNVRDFEVWGGPVFNPWDDIEED
jgi:predicted nucleic acid-binding protein